MAYGLVTKGASGVVEIDSTIRLTRIVSVWQVYRPNLSDDEIGVWYDYDSPSITGLVDDGTWYAMTPGLASNITFIGGGKIRVRFYSYFQNDDYAYVTIGRY